MAQEDCSYKAAEDDLWGRRARAAAAVDAAEELVAAFAIAVSTASTANRRDLTRSDFQKAQELVSPLLEAYNQSQDKDAASGEAPGRRLALNPDQPYRPAVEHGWGSYQDYFEGYDDWIAHLKEVGYDEWI